MAVVIDGTNGVTVPAGATGDEVPQAQETYGPKNGQLAGMRNKLIGNFLVNQRALTSVADDTYCLDRWYVLTETGNVTVAQVTDPESGAPFGIRLTQPDASPKRIGIAQIIESQNIRQYASQAMNFFARVKLSASTGIRYAIIEHTGTADVVTSDVVNNWASTAFTPSNFFIAGINILKTGVVTPGAAVWGEVDDWSALGAGVKNVVLFIWSESALAQNATLEINRPQYEPGVVATPHEWRLNEIDLCFRRYIEAPNGSAVNAAPGQYSSAQFPTRMAGTPNVTIFGFVGSVSSVVATPFGVRASFTAGPTDWGYRAEIEL